jgi:flagellar biosynthesis/type III secretory pathway protein FliH
MKQVRFQPETKLIKAKELDAITEAETLIATARTAVADADKFRAAIAEETRKHVERGMTQELRARVAAEVGDAVRQLQQQLQPHSQELAAIISDISERIWQETPPSERIRGLVQKALDDYQDRQMVAICVCPTEAEEMRRIVDQQIKTNSVLPIKVEASPDLKPGDIVLKTAKGLVEIGFSRQIAEVRRALGL